MIFRCFFLQFLLSFIDNQAVFGDSGILGIITEGENMGILPVDTVQVRRVE